MARLQRDEDHIPGTNATEANGSGHDISVAGAVVPAGVTTSTISKWLKVMDNGTAYYIPMWT